MYELNFILLHCGDQFVGCIIWIIIGVFITVVLPIILLFGLLYWVAKKFADKDERERVKKENS